MTGVEKPATTLAEHFGDAPVSEHGARWNACWEAATTPWDRGGPSLALADVLEGQRAAELFPWWSSSSSSEEKTTGDHHRHPTALVPGCGRGHDVLLLASFGFDVVGLDISARAVAEARRNAAALTPRLDDVYPLRGPVPNRRRGSVKFLVGDFFADAFVRDAAVPAGRFDFIFDYTFGCALPPSAKPAWARRYQELLAPGGGRLVCLEFPSTKAPAAAGPPWAMPPHAYLAYLGRPGETPATDAHGGVLADRVVGPPGPEGLRRLLHLKPARTHPGGTAEDGTVLDWISVWAHNDDNDDDA